ncbi:MAG: DNA ligase [Sterolibacteriaceae bacterium MAG5]|nr:DNA ligase [Candidatus Nitricoxidireducens bremensis]
MRRPLAWALAACLSLFSLFAAAQTPPLLLAGTYRADIDPAGYWVSEKYDGVRAVWDGRELRFRSGRPVPAPGWFVAGLPSQALDGELWLGRGRFDALSAIVRKAEPLDAEWRQVKYMVFELPDAPGSFTERIEAMKRIVAASRLPNLRAVEQFRVADRAELARRLDAVVKGGGEGLMLHRAAAAYRTGRSDDLLKLKPYRDAEARVVGHEPGRGRLRGLTGALRMEMPDGRRFRLGAGLGDAERRQPPPVGSLVTYRYQELTPGGLPRFPRYWRVREEF